MITEENINAAKTELQEIMQLSAYCEDDMTQELREAIVKALRLLGDDVTVS